VTSVLVWPSRALSVTGLSFLLVGLTVTRWRKKHCAVAWEYGPYGSYDSNPKGGLWQHKDGACAPYVCWKVRSN
jgi:hypothetical protein